MNLKSLQLSLMQAALQRKLRAIRANPQQEIPTLLDLREFFPSERSHDAQLAAVKRQLADENSAYYRLVARLIREVSEEHLSSFLLNFAYQSFNSGKKEIRSIQKREKIHVPWCLFVDVGSQSQHLTPSQLSQLFSAAQPLGLRCFLLDAAPSYPAFPALLRALQAADSCAFLLFLPPELVDAKSILQLAKTQNLLTLLDLDAAEGAALPSAIERLRRNRRLYGGFSRCGEVEASLPEAMRRAAAWDLPLLILRDANLGQLSLDEHRRARLDQLRQSLSAPLLPIDLYQDAAAADREVSGAAALGFVLSDGRFAFCDERRGYRVTEQSPLTQPLRAVFKTLRSP